MSALMELLGRLPEADRLGLQEVIQPTAASGSTTTSPSSSSAPVPTGNVSPDFSGAQAERAAAMSRVLYEAGFRGDEIPMMVAIGLGESSGNPNAYNPNANTGDQSYGLWQINMLGAMGPERREWFGIDSNEDLFDPLTNARAAYKLYKARGNFGDWSVYNKGVHEQYLPLATQVASQVTGEPISGDLGYVPNDLGSDGIPINDAPLAAPDADNYPSMAGSAAQAASYTPSAQAPQATDYSSLDERQQAVLSALGAFNDVPYDGLMQTEGAGMTPPSQAFAVRQPDQQTDGGMVVTASSGQSQRIDGPTTASAQSLDPDAMTVPGAVDLGEPQDIAQDAGTPPVGADTVGSPVGTGTGLGSIDAGLGLDPLLGIAESLTQSTGNLMGIGSDLSTLIDPALMASLGELGLSEDLGVRNALESGVRLVLNSAEQRRRLGNMQQREQELTAANLTGRGIGVSVPESNEGLVGNTFQALGTRQGQNLADFETDFGDRMRGLLSGLGNTQLGSVGDIGGQLVGGVQRYLDDELARQNSVIGG